MESSSRKATVQGPLDSGGAIQWRPGFVWLSGRKTCPHDRLGPKALQSYAASLPAARM